MSDDKSPERREVDSWLASGYHVWFWLCAGGVVFAAFVLHWLGWK